ncbi:TolC family protein [Carboxylicivirga sp. RSCT41]|uniref:TolC family protein n=1 Tax=Carboxylicivirga agarovorans TaxID=3417570 RepID=UPI003D34988F
MKKIVLVIACSCFSMVVGAQSTIPEILESIEQNNYSLKSLRAQTDAIVLKNKTGLNPSNPQVEYIYQWGNKSQAGNKQEFHIRQSFDFPTAYRYRKQMTESMSEKAERDYLNAYNIVMLDAQCILFRLIFQEALIQEYSQRLKHAETIARAFHAKFDEGDANILERNKADINLLNAQNKLAELRSEYELLNERLQSLNGGKQLEITFVNWPLLILPTDFDDWFNANADIIPEIQSLQEGVDANRYREKLNKALSLPKLTGGYSSESDEIDKFKGVNVGLTIPLWENKNTVKQAKLNTIAIENELEDKRLQLYHGLKALYAKTKNRQIVAGNYRQSLKTMNNVTILETALEAGQITILEYMMEQSIYYTTIENALNAELESQLSYAQMMAFQIY